MGNQRSEVISAAILGAVITGVFVLLGVYFTHYLSNGNQVTTNYGPSSSGSSSDGNTSYTSAQISNIRYAAGSCITVSTQNNESAVVTGDVKINGNNYYNGDPTTGALDIIGSNETVNVCGDFGFNLQTHIPNSQLQSVVSGDVNNMERNSGCGSKCSNVITNNV